MCECGHRFQQDGHKTAIPAFVIEPGEMLNCGSSTLTRKLQQSILVDALAELGWQLVPFCLSICHRGFHASLEPEMGPLSTVCCPPANLSDPNDYTP
jgi:hypothetical protein